MATYDEADATKIVKNAIVDYGITTPIDIKNNTLGKYPLELSPGTDYARLLGYINLGIANPKISYPGHSKQMVSNHEGYRSDYNG